MARTEARIKCAVWRNRDFTSLPLEAQGLYWMLLSQPDVSLAGVVPYNHYKWEHLTKGDVLEALSALEVGGFVMPDPTTGELWIRTFTKHDGVLAGEKTRAGMWSAWHNILSVGIRARFLEHLEDEHINESLEREWVTQSDLEDARSEFEQQAQDGVSDGVSTGTTDRASDGASLARAESASASDSYSDKPLAPDKPTPKKKSRKPDPIFDAVIQACGINPSELTDGARGAANKAVKELKAVGASPQGIHARAKVHLDRWPQASLTPSSLAKNYAQLNAKPSANGRRTDEPHCQLCDRPLSKPDHDELCEVFQ